jgi:hypothetical protein
MASLYGFIRALARIASWLHSRAVCVRVCALWRRVAAARTPRGAGGTAAGGIVRGPGRVGLCTHQGQVTLGWR